MKRIKLIGLFFIVFLLPILLFTGCKANRPSDKQILNDLSENLSTHINTEYRFLVDFEMSVDKFAVETSMSGENMYTASMIAITKNNYADYFWPVEVKYIKKDQNWSLLNCEWGEYTYEQVRYPDKSEIEHMVEEAGLYISPKDEITYEKDSIKYHSNANADWSKYASGKSDTIIIFKYRQYKDNWYYDDTENITGTFTLTKELEGKWKLRGDVGYMIIENVTDTGFDVSISGWEEQRFTQTHFELSSGTIEYYYGPTLNLYFNSKFIIQLYKDPSKYQNVDLLFTWARGHYVAQVINESSKME